MVRPLVQMLENDYFCFDLEDCRPLRTGRRYDHDR